MWDQQARTQIKGPLVLPRVSLQVGRSGNRAAPLSICRALYGIGGATMSGRVMLAHEVAARSKARFIEITQEPRTRLRSTLL